MVEVGHFCQYDYVPKSNYEWHVRVVFLPRPLLIFIATLNMKHLNSCKCLLNGN